MYERLLTWILKPALAIFSMVASCKLPLGSPKRNFDLLVLFIFRPRRGTPRVGDIALLLPVPQDCNLGFSGDVVSALWAEPVEPQARHYMCQTVFLPSTVTSPRASAAMVAG